MTKDFSLKGILNFIYNQRNKIRVKLFITYFIIIIILVVGIGAFSYSYSSNSIEKKIQSANVQIIDQINKNMEFKFTQIKNIMLIPYNYSDYIAGVNIYSKMSDLDKITFQRKMNDYFFRYFFINPISDLENFYIYTNTGTMIFSSSGIKQDINPREFSRLDWVKKTIKKNGRIYFSHAREETVGGRNERIYSTSIMIKDISLRTNFSIVKADLNFDEISKIFSNGIIGNKSETTIVDEVGKVIYSTGNRKLSSDFDKDVVSKIHNTNGTFWIRTSKGEYMVSYTKSGISGWNIISMIPKGDIFDASTQIKRMTIFISIIGLILTGMISFIFSLKITKPLLKLNKMIDRVKKGDLSIRMEPISEDEIGKIYSTINELIVEVNSLIENKYIYQIKEKQYELNLLYAQINPHFFYNTLDTIKVMADSKEIENVSQMITLLGDMFRYGVRDINDQVTVRQELDYVEDYLKICRFRFGQKVDFSIEVDESIMDYKITRLILQPIIENCMLHGRYPGRNKLFIHVNGWRNQNNLVFVIKDDGIGMDEETLLKVRQAFKLEIGTSTGNSQGSRIGLVNINNRLRLLYGEKDFIDVSSWQNIGTEIQLSIPLQEI